MAVVPDRISLAFSGRRRDKIKTKEHKKKTGNGQALVVT